MDGTANQKELRHDRYTVSLLSDHMVFAPKYRGKILIDDVGNGWEVVSKYIETQDVHHAKNAICRPRP